MFITRFWDIVHDNLLRHARVKIYSPIVTHRHPYHSFINLFIHQWLYSPLLGPGLFFSFVIFFTQTVELRGRVISSLQQPAHAGSSLADFYTLKMEAIRSSETSVHTRSTRRHIPEDGILHSHRRENLKSYVKERISRSCMLLT
jgi:hypothetical protein